MRKLDDAEINNVAGGSYFNMSDFIDSIMANTNAGVPSNTADRSDFNAALDDINAGVRYLPLG